MRVKVFFVNAFVLPKLLQFKSTPVGLFVMRIGLADM